MLYVMFQFFAAGCEPDIEEHFRRSLGRDYMTSNSPKLVNPPPPPPPPKAPTPPEEVVQTARGSASPKEGDKNNPANVSITGQLSEVIRVKMNKKSNSCTDMWDQMM